MLNEEQQQVEIETNEIASILAEWILKREREYDELVAAGKEVPRNQRSHPTMLTPGFARDGKLIFEFDEEIIIPAELQKVQLRTGALSPKDTAVMNDT